MSEHSADCDAGHAYTEYGVLVDGTSVGLGVYLAEATRDLERAQSLARRSPDAWGYPAEVKARRVYVTGWTSVTPPGLDRPSTAFERPPGNVYLVPEGELDAMSTNDWPTEA